MLKHMGKKNPNYDHDKMGHTFFPARLIVISFIIVILIGSLLLTLPISSRNFQFTNPLTAVFTATTSTCVTGLVVVGTANYWSVFGHIVILLLIQIGGLGLVTLTTFFVIVLRQKIGLSNLTLAQESTGTNSIQNLAALVKLIVVSTLLIEFLGAAVLCIRFIPEFGIKGVWISIFTAISAYCNAGIDIFPQDFGSLVPYQNDVLVNITVMALIVIGGLGFIVFQDIIYRRKTKHIMLHTRVVATVTIVLIVTGAILYFIFEYSNPKTMGNMSLPQKILASFFQSVTTRTAGFNTVDYGAMHEHTQIMTNVLMFIGAAPGSTAGGIKVTTFAVVVMTVWATLKNNTETTIFRRKVDHGVVYKSFSIIILGIVLITTTSTVLILENDISTIQGVFEATSAMGTVGLSTGITPSLGIASQIAIILTMFIGRVGSFAFFMALTLGESKTSKKIVLPEGQIMVG